MSVSRIYTVHVAAGREPEIVAAYRAMMPSLRDSPGFLDMRLMRNRDDPTLWTGISVWESAEALETYAAAPAGAANVALMAGIPADEPVVTKWDLEELG